MLFLKKAQGAVVTMDYFRGLGFGYIHPRKIALASSKHSKQNNSERPEQDCGLIGTTGHGRGAFWYLIGK